MWMRNPGDGFGTLDTARISAHNGYDTDHRLVEGRLFQVAGDPVDIHLPSSVA